MDPSEVEPEHLDNGSSRHIDDINRLEKILSNADNQPWMKMMRVVVFLESKLLCRLALPAVMV